MLVFFYLEKKMFKINVYFLLVLLILSVTVVKMLSVKMHVSIPNFHLEE